MGEFYSERVVNCMLSLLAFFGRARWPVRVVRKFAEKMGGFGLLHLHPRLGARRVGVEFSSDQSAYYHHKAVQPS